MITKDIGIFESGDGGELSIVSGDLLLSESILQQVYLALFGGNIESNTIGNEIDSQERFDYWANGLLWPQNPDKQFNSNTERALNELVLNSSGRIKVINAVESDLDYLKLIVNFEVSVSIVSKNSVRISVVLLSKNNLENKQLVLVYDNAKNELIINKVI